MITIPCAELVPAQVELDSALQAFIKAKADKGDFQLLYIGADWCAPCKALKPIIEAELINYPELMSFAINLDEELNLSDSQMVTQLPTVLLCHKGRVKTSIAGLVEYKAIRQLFSLLEDLSQKPHKQARQLEHQEFFAEQGEQDAVIQLIKDKLTQKGVLASKTYYQELPAQLRYNPRVQQAKTLIDLVDISEQQLKRCEQDNLNQVLDYFVNLKVSKGLDLMAQHQLWQQAGMRDLYILAVNTITDHKLANCYRKLLAEG